MLPHGGAKFVYAMSGKRGFLGALGLNHRRGGAKNIMGDPKLLQFVLPFRMGGELGFEGALILARGFTGDHAQGKSGKGFSVHSFLSQIGVQFFPQF